jgi:hypothetical protein
LVVVAALGSVDTALAAEAFVSEWAVEPPYALSIDSTGFSMPTALAFVSDPGPLPTDPRYFVVELRGDVKVVTNEGSVLEFASVPAGVPARALPDPAGELGAAGICLDDENGYVFVTFAGQGTEGTLSNRLMRFDTVPHSFAVTYRDSMEIAEPIGRAQSAPSHQIGDCAVSDGQLFVGVGDGKDASSSGDIDVLLGKVLAMDVDGQPLSTNPFIAEDSESARFVYASGFRNPFAIEVVEGTVVVFDNGLGLDRLILVEPGVNYLWDGTDSSIAASATAIVDPSVGPVNLARGTLPGRGDGLFFSTSSEGGLSGIWFVPIDYQRGHPTGLSEQIVRYLGDGYPAVTAIGWYQDDIYFARLAPDSPREADVFKLESRPPTPHPVPLEPLRQDPFHSFGCAGCHRREGEGGDVGPSLDFFERGNRERVLAYLESESFETMLRSLDERSDEPFVSTRDARREVLSAEGLARLHAYVRNKMLEPRFADPDAQMPQLGLREQDAEEIASELASPWQIRVYDFGFVLRRFVPFPGTRSGDMLAGGIVGGALVGVLFVAVGLGRRILKVILRERRSASPTATKRT